MDSDYSGLGIQLYGHKRCGEKQRQQGDCIRYIFKSILGKVSFDDTFLFGIACACVVHTQVQRECRSDIRYLSYDTRAYNVPRLVLSGY